MSDARVVVVVVVESGCVRRSMHAVFIFVSVLLLSRNLYYTHQVAIPNSLRVVRFNVHASPRLIERDA